jgi:hypothetical protein
MSAPKYTVEPGRGIARTADGKVLVTLHRVEVDAKDHPDGAKGCHTLAPWEADDFTHEVALGLNHHDALGAALRELLRTMVGRHDATVPSVVNACAVLAAYDDEKKGRRI